MGENNKPGQQWRFGAGQPRDRKAAGHGELSTKRPFHWRVHSVAAQVWPENRNVCSLVELYSKVEEPRSINAVTMQQDYSGCSLNALDLPPTRLRTVAITPGFVRYFQCRPTDLTKTLRRYQIGMTRRARNSIND